MKLKIKTYFPLLLTILLASCIKEDLSHCGCDKPTNAYIYLSYKGDGNKEIFFDKIESVNLYAFDENEKLAGTFRLNKADFNNTQFVALDLPDGNYRLVCWANVGSETQINIDPLMNQSIVGSPKYFTRDIITTNDSLYFGSKKIIVPNPKNVADTVQLKGEHHKIQLMIDGYNATTLSARASETLPFTVEIANLAPTINFNEEYSIERVSYFPTLNYDTQSKQYTSNFNVLPFRDDNEIVLKLKNSETGQLIHSIQLKDFMKQYNISVDGKNESKVGIRIIFKSAAISVEPWTEETIKPGI